MVKYECFRCGYIASQKIGLVRHLKRKNICEAKINNICIDEIKKHYGFEVNPNESKMNPNESKMNPKITEKMNPYESKMNPKLSKNESILDSNLSKKKYICDFCNKCYSTNSNLHKHLKNCKMNINNIEYIKKKNKELEETIEKLLLDKKNNIINTTNNNSNNTTNNNYTTNNTVNIHINNYGDENTKYITNDFILNLLEKPYSAIPELIKYTHFNDEHPENQNIKITNKKDPYMKILKNKKWELVDKKDTINDLIDQKHSILNKIDIKNNVDDNTYNRIELFNKKYLDDDKVMLNKLYKDSELVLLNNS